MNLEWKKVDNATGYKLYFGKDNPPTDTLNGIDVGDVETYTVENLEYLTTYYWKVVPYNTAGDAFECPVWSFTTEELITIPPCVRAVSPQDGSTEVGTINNGNIEVYLEWTSEETATGYKLYVGEDAAIDLGNVTSTTVQVPEYSHLYFWRVEPHNLEGDALNCPTWHFTTLEPVLINPVTTILTPVEEEGGYKMDVTVKDFIAVGAVSLVLNYVPEVISYKSIDINPALSGAISNDLGGQVRIGWLATAENLTVSLPPESVLFTMHFEVLPTTAETTQFTWSVVTGECEYASYGGEIIYNSTGTIPTCTNITYPSNGLLNVPLTITLKWIHALNTKGYKLYLGTDNPPTNVENGTDLGYVTEHTVTLETEKKYYWKLVPYNDTGDAINCPVISFITTGVPPICTKCITPEDGTLELPINLKLEWSSVQRATGYKLFFGIDVDNLNFFIDVGNNTSYQPASLIYDKIYYWKIVPYNYYGDADNCPIWKFSTEKATNENHPPVIKPQKFECKAYKNFNDVGRVHAYDPDETQLLRWDIVKGNEQDLFYIESCSGYLMYFKDPNMKVDSKSADGISAEGDLVKKFEIVVKVTDNAEKPLSSYAQITILVYYSYVFPIGELNAKKLSDSFQQPITGTIVSKDEKILFTKDSKESTFNETLAAISNEEKSEYKMSVITNDNKRIYIKIQN